MTTDLYDDDDDQTDGSPAIKQLRQQVKTLQKELKSRDDATERLANLERENVVLRTPGLGELSDVQRRALFAAHDGELDPKGLRETAEALGFVSPPPPPPTDGEADAHTRAAGAAAGASAGLPGEEQRAAVLGAKSADEFWRNAEAAGLASDS